MIRQVLFPIAVIVLAGWFTNSSAQGNAPLSTSDSSAHAAHENYVKAINSNQLDSLLGMLTGYVVFLAANEPVMEGKQAV